jgi:aminobenzoyl-glutamate transport protein
MVQGGSWLDRLERAGNRLPDSTTLFLAGIVLVLILSELAVTLDWSVEKLVRVHGALRAETVTAVSLLGNDGLWWIFAHLVENFVDFPPLGLVLVGLLGIGRAERRGLRYAAVIFLGVALLILAAVMIPGAPLAGEGERFPRWMEAMVPLLLILMQVGISPEQTQAAYRIGDSVTNGITPFNPYLVMILVFVRRYVPQAGLGTLLALMLPYTIAFALAWSALLGVWVVSGWPLGAGG